MNRWHWASLLLAVCLSGCASLPGATTDTVDGRTVEYVQAGQGTPVVVFENGAILEQGPPTQIFDNPQVARTRDFLSHLGWEG